MYQSKHIKQLLNTRRNERHYHNIYWLLLIIVVITMWASVLQPETVYTSSVVEDAPKYGTQEHMTMFANQYGEGWQRLY